MVRLGTLYVVLRYNEICWPPNLFKYVGLRMILSG
jgi:hypothetical protein